MCFFHIFILILLWGLTCVGMRLESYIFYLVRVLRLKLGIVLIIL